MIDVLQRLALSAAVLAIAVQLGFVIRSPLTASRGAKESAEAVPFSSAGEGYHWTPWEPRLAREAAMKWSSEADSPKPMTLAVNEAPLPAVQRIATDRRGAAVYLYEASGVTSGPHRVGDSIGALTLEAIGHEVVTFLTPQGLRMVTFRNPVVARAESSAPPRRSADEMIPSATPAKFVGAIAPGIRASERPRPPSQPSK